MLTVYVLPIDENSTDTMVLGIEFIHDAVLLMPPDPSYRVLIMDTTPTEHSQLDPFARVTRPPTPNEEALFRDLVKPHTPDPDADRAVKLLAFSGDLITTTEMQELIRILARRLGFVVN